MDIHFIFIKYRMLCAVFVQSFVDCRHLFIFMRVTDTQGWRCPVPYKPRRRQPTTHGSGMQLTSGYLVEFYCQQLCAPAWTLVAKIAGSVFDQLASQCADMLKRPARARPAGNDFRPSTPDSVNQLILRPTDERAQQSVLATSLTRSPRCNISMAVSLRA